MPTSVSQYSKKFLVKIIYLHMNFHIDILESSNSVHSYLAGINNHCSDIDQI